MPHSDLDFYLSQKQFQPKHRSRDLKQSIGALKFNIAYHVNALIGTPAKNFSLLLDTGSPSIWVISSSCKSLTCRASPSIYNHALSNTAKRTGRADQIFYGDGSMIYGDIYQETIKINDIVVLNQPFISVNASTEAIGATGLVGMSLPVSTGRDPNTYWTYALAEGASADGSFSLWFNSAAKGDGELILGGVDTTKFEGQINFYPVIPGGQNNKGIFWQIQYDSITTTSFALNGSQTDNTASGDQNSNSPSINPDMCSQGDCIVIIDSGTSDLLVQNSIAYTVQTSFPSITSTTQTGCTQVQSMLTSSLSYANSDEICEDPHSWFHKKCDQLQFKGGHLCLKQPSQLKLADHPHTNAIGLGHHPDKLHVNTFRCSICKKLAKEYGKKAFKSCQTGGRRLKQDLSPERMEMDTSTCSNANKTMSGTIGYTIFDCKYKVLGPQINIAIGGINYTVGPDDYVEEFHPNQCIARVLPYNKQSNNILVGVPFMRAWYSVFDQKSRKVGLAKAIIDV